MNNTEKHSNELKEKILTDPNIILEDSDLMIGSRLIASPFNALFQ